MIFILSILIIIFLYKKISTINICNLFNWNIPVISTPFTESKPIPVLEENKTVDYNNQIKEYLEKEDEPNYLSNNIFFDTYDKPDHPYVQVL